MPCWQQSRKLDIADSSCRGWERHRRSDSQCGCVCVKTNPFCWWNKKLSPSGPPATQSKSKTQTWGRTAGRQKETKWCRSCTLTGVEKEVSIVWHWLVKIKMLGFTLKIPGGMKRQWPSLPTTTFVWYVPSNFSSALKRMNILQEWMFEWRKTS